MFRSVRPKATINRQEAHEFLNMYPMGRNGAQIDPNAAQALSLPAFWRGLRLRSGLISTLPLTLGEAGQLPPILIQPDPTEDLQVTLNKMETSLILRGEFVAVLGDFDEFGFPNSLKVIDPSAADLKDNGTWIIGSRTYSRDEVLHRASGLIPGETRGISAIELFRRVLAGEQAAQEFQRNYYSDGAMPPAVITVDKSDVAPKELNRILAAWRNKMLGRREPVVLPADISVTPMPLTNADAQFLEGRQFALVDIANIVGVPPYFVGAPGSNRTYANVRDERKQLVDEYLREDMFLIERAFSSLFENMFTVKFDTDSYLRLDPKTIAETLVIEGNYRTIDEMREKAGLPPLPDGRGQTLGSLVLPGAPNASTQEGEGSGATN